MANVVQTLLKTIHRLIRLEVGYGNNCFTLASGARRCLVNGRYAVMRGEEYFFLRPIAFDLLGRLPGREEELRRYYNRILSVAKLEQLLHELVSSRIIKRRGILRHPNILAAMLWDRISSRITGIARAWAGPYILFCKTLLLRESVERRLMYIESNDSKAERFLIIAVGGLGDMVFITPLLRELKTARPGAQIDVLTKAKVAEFFANCPYVNSILICPPLRALFRNATTPHPFALQLYHGGYTTAISCMESFGGIERWFAGKAICYLTGAPRIIGSLDSVSSRHRSLVEYLGVSAVPIHREHEVCRALSLLNPLNITPVRKDLEVWPDHMPANVLHTFIPREVKEYIYVGLAPFTAHDKMWPLEHFARLAEHLGQDSRICIVLLGGKQHARAAASICGSCSTPIRNIVGQTNLLELIEFIGKLSLLVSPDTGPAHIAAAMRIPQVMLFGPTSTYRFGPWNNPHAISIAASNHDISTIPFKHVYEACMRSLRRCGDYEIVAEGASRANNSVNCTGGEYYKQKVKIERSAIQTQPRLLRGV